MKKTDILLPFWGDIELFKKTVLSIITQTQKNWRLIISDDAYPSTDQVEFIKSLNDHRIEYHRQQKNIGITNNFNFVVQQATAEFCIVIGCDDVLLPNYLERATSKIGEADFYQPGVDVINRDGQSYSPITDRVKKLLRPKAGIYKGEPLAVSLCRGNWLYFPSILWKTSTLKKYSFDSSLSVVQDVNLELNIITDNGSLCVDDSITFQYRRYSDSLSSKEKKSGGVRFKEESAVYNKYSKIFKEIGWKKAAHASKLRFTSRVNEFLS